MLCFSLALIGFVPWFLNLALKETQQHLTARAEANALILGSTGSALELVLNSLYFNKEMPAAIPMQAVSDINRSKLAYAIPLNTFYHAADVVIVGTSLDYFSFRKLKINQGRQMGILGETVIGANVAAKKSLRPGDKLISSPDNVFDISGSYPLQLEIVGILEKTGSADDDVIFVDLRSSWIMSGLGHGHEDLANLKDPSLVQKNQDGNLVANTNVKTFTVISKENLASFHFHGDESQFPLSSALVIPKNERNATLLLGRYLGDPALQMLEPIGIVQNLLSTLFRIKRVLDAVVWIVIFSTALTMILVFVLSLRLRSKELSLLFQLGSSQNVIAGFVLSEMALIVLSSFVLASLFLLLSGLFREQLILKLIAS
jgi:putative ABC transport system permease protein